MVCWSALYWIALLKVLDLLRYSVFCLNITLHANLFVKYKISLIAFIRILFNRQIVIQS